ncbi:cation/H(+) antiporter 28-like [Gastrolobium bilobum]|uniref:cation/H(+) antiporter 28-like n=1 Tax=Gastrolobium bilobum TaxID=150636 RepID=UPI002AB1B0C5|nr:cation/H(+) antiporter 28-like [Gastrolobium bilobum]
MIKPKELNQHGGGGDGNGYGNGDGGCDGGSSGGGWHWRGGGDDSGCDDGGGNSGDDGGDGGSRGRDDNGNGCGLVVVVVVTVVTAAMVVVTLIFCVSMAITQCSLRLANLMFQVGRNFAMFMAMVIMCNILHFILKPYKQPRITSDLIVGLIMGNVPFLRRLYGEFNRNFEIIIDFGMMCYMFTLGIEMDPYVLFKRPTRDVKVAYAGIISTFILALSLIPILHYFGSNHGLKFTFCYCILLSSTASPVLTRLITQLKIGKSDIGKLVIAAGMHSDCMCSLLLSLGYIFMPLDTFCTDPEEKHRVDTAIAMGCAVLGQTLFTAMVSPIFMNWVNNENPEGKPMKGSHLVLSIAFMIMICASSTLYNYSPILSAFMTGVCFPREGRVSKWVISKINYMLNIIFFPIFFLWVGCASDFRKFEFGQLVTWLRLLLSMFVLIIGKVAGTVISGAMLGFHWPDSVAIGLLLTIKGHFHMYLAIKVMGCGISSISTSIGMVITVFISLMPAPIVVAHIIKRARKRVPTHRMALQLLDPLSELRVLLCVHGPENVPASINFMEISRGTADPGILVYVAEMIELTDQLAASVEKGEEVHTTIVKDQEVMEMRDQITSSFQAYVDEDGDGITLKRTLAVSTINNMAQDISVLAEDLMITLIILPFHMNQRQDGKLDSGNQGFRYVNRKVLRSAPCSVGILVNRGFGSIAKISKSQASVNVAVIFIGGKDDREALAYAGRVAGHPGVKLTVIRFLVDTSAESSKLAAYRVSLPEQEEEMGMDDEYFAQFYEKHIVGGRISYTEKHLANAAETFSTLRSFEGQYSLVIVGREGGVNSILTKGMNDWQHCPELGPIGDVLSGSDFSMTVSVLIIQQHKLRGELDGLDDDFSIM